MNRQRLQLILMIPQWFADDLVASEGWVLKREPSGWVVHDGLYSYRKDTDNENPIGSYGSGAVEIELDPVTDRCNIVWAVTRTGGVGLR